MSELFTTEALSALLQVIMIDLVLAGDNAIVIGLATLPLRNRVIVVTGVRFSTSANPNPSAHTGTPSIATATENPGAPRVSM